MLVTTSADTLWVNLFSDFCLFFFLWIIIRALETKVSFVTQTMLTVVDPGEGLGGLPPPIFRWKWGPKGRKKIFLEGGRHPIWRSGSATGWIRLAGSHVTWEMSIYPNKLYLYCSMQFSNFLKVQCLSGWRWLSFGSNEQKPGFNQWFFRNQESTVYPPFNFCGT